MADRLLHLPANAADVATLRAAGYELASDKDFVAAFASRLSISTLTAEMVLAGTLDDVVTVAA